jgi:DNA-binding IclR family transcriptional regulator
MPFKNHHMLELSLSILETVAASPDGLSVSDVYTRFSIPRSSASILMRTFANLGYMTRDRGGFYSIGPKAFEVGASFTRNSSVFTYAGTVLDALVAATEETAHMGILSGTDVIYVCKSECSHAMRMISQVGKRVPAHSTAVGKALLSMKPAVEIRAMYADRPLEQLTPSTVTDLDALLAQLQEIRDEGFATEQEESTAGVTCIAIPLQGKAGSGAAAISVSVPLIRLGAGLERFKKPLWEAGEKIRVIL